MSGVKGSVHVWVSHRGKVLWMVFAEFIGVCCRVLLYGWGIDVEDSGILPYFLVLFFYGDEGISFICLVE